MTAWKLLWFREEKSALSDGRATKFMRSGMCAPTWEGLCAGGVSVGASSLTAQASLSSTPPRSLPARGITGNLMFAPANPSRSEAGASGSGPFPCE